MADAATEFDGGIATRLDAVPFSIVVNREGARFHDEGEDFWPKRYAIWGRLIARQPGQQAFAILDAKAETLFLPSIYPAHRSGTIEGLAESLGLAPGALRATVDGYNAACGAQGPFDPAALDGRRTMEICNACRYREGYCPVFPAMELRRGFGDACLANLCHNCRGCWYACQYAPPHEWGLNLPAAFAAVRAESYADHAWPRPLGRLFARNGKMVHGVFRLLALARHHAERDVSMTRPEAA